jgi:hypothetical protein
MSIDPFSFFVGVGIAIFARLCILVTDAIIEKIKEEKNT